MTEYVCGPEYFERVCACEVFKNRRIYNAYHRCAAAVAVAADVPRFSPTPSGIGTVMLLTVMMIYEPSRRRRRADPRGT